MRFSARATRPLQDILVISKRLSSSFSPKTTDYRATSETDWILSEIATVPIIEPDKGINLAVLNVDETMLKGHEIEIELLRSCSQS
jgi:hypothetical protein